MPVTTSAQAIIVAALATSAKNRPEYLATNTSEALDVLTREQRAAFSVAARVAPTYFADSVAVPYAAPGWARPQNAQVIFRLTNINDDRVEVIPYDDLDLLPESPCVYRLGGVYRTRGNAVDPTSAEELTFWYGRVPEAFSALADLLDAQWPEAYNTLLIADLAMYFARKDGRDPAPFQPDRDAALAGYVNFLKNETVNEVRRDFDTDSALTMPTLEELQRIMLGGPSV